MALVSSETSEKASMLTLAAQEVTECKSMLLAFRWIKSTWSHKRQATD